MMKTYYEGDDERVSLKNIKAPESRDGSDGVNHITSTQRDCQTHEIEYDMETMF